MQDPTAWPKNRPAPDAGGSAELPRPRSDLDLGLEEILPSGAVAVATTSKMPGDPLFPQEAAIIAGAVATRRREFAIARSCARRALAQLGLPPLPILQGASRQPLWPDGVVGSITHSCGFFAAAAARRSVLLTLGIDAEPNEALPPGVLDLISLEEERGAFPACACTGAAPDRLLFSAKESLFKAWFPIAGTWLGFEDAVVSIDPEHRRFSARLLVDPPPTVEGWSVARFEGRFTVRAGLIVTTMALRSPDAATPADAPPQLKGS